jgi:hypothetical protein
VSERLLGLSGELLFWWHALHDGYTDLDSFDRRLAGVKRRVRAALVGGARGGQGGHAVRRPAASVAGAVAFRLCGGRGADQQRGAA